MQVTIPNNILDALLIAGVGCKNLDTLEEVFEEARSFKVNGESFLETHDVRARGHFYAHLAHESGNFERTEENLNYSARRLLKVFPSRIDDLAHAKRLVRDKKALFDHLYGGRMGNAQDEGYKYIGRGYIGLTGKDNYTTVGDIVDMDFVNDPEEVAEPEGAWAATYGFLLKKGRRLSSPLESLNVSRATYIINGGRNGLNDRQMRLNHIKLLLAGEITCKGEPCLRKTGMIDTLVQYYLAAFENNDIVIDGIGGKATRYYFKKHFKRDVKTLSTKDIKYMLKRLSKHYMG